MAMQGNIWHLWLLIRSDVSCVTHSWPKPVRWTMSYWIHPKKTCYHKQSIIITRTSPILLVGRDSKRLRTTSWEDWCKFMFGIRILKNFWKAMRTYPLPHHQTSEQFLSTGCDTPEFILHTPPWIFILISMTWLFIDVFIIYSFYEVFFFK